ncbi:cytochrome P450 2J2-like isoform X2 [Labeo rohita]|uniref:Cytochrome P450 2J2-like isoform X2 n=1 Tax=Labeo rohita TaxID=84645 RepID=A0A498MXR0_LABRO|nr:cytochrome P450 2J2-like isoform X2 [Labeo rohita]
MENWFAKQYGNILSIRILGSRIVVLIGYKTVKQVYLQEGDNLADRPKLPIFYDTFGDKGLVAANGYSWKQQRRFALSTLQNFGMGKKSLEPSIQLECHLLNEAISSQPFDPHILLSNAVSNVICVLVFGDRFEYSDNDFQTLLKKIRDSVVFWGSIWVQLYNMFPWLIRRVPGPHKKIITVCQEVIDFIQGKVNAHRVDYDPSNPRDYIDCFLAEMEKPEDDTDAGFDVETLCFCTLDLFFGGTETTSTTLCWGLLYMMKYPEIQAKVQEEIDRVVGGSRQPSLSDRDNMPYTNAVIHEIQRIGNTVPLNLVRATVKETQIGKYFIPKGTVVIGSLTSVLFDESEWETPHSFNPGHFLDNEGKFRRRDAFLPFSLDYDPSKPQDYIDCFLAKMEKLKDDTAAGFDVENLCICTLDLFVAGSETTFTTLYWGLLYMMKYPEIQARVQEEIDCVVGGSSLSGRDNMPYTNAVIHEIQWIGNIGTAVIGSLTSVLFDESEWETPHSFNPGHFLDAEGKFRRRDAFLPFSLGLIGANGYKRKRQMRFALSTLLTFGLGKKSL